jgi:hypothetical protein
MVNTTPNPLTEPKPTGFYFFFFFIKFKKKFSSISILIEPGVLTKRKE